MQRFSDAVLTVATDSTSLIPFPEGTITVYVAGTSDIAEIFTANSTAAVGSNPFMTDQWGNVDFYARNGRYDILVARAGIASVRLDDVLFNDPKDEPYSDIAIALPGDAPAPKKVPSTELLSMSVGSGLVGFQLDAIGAGTRSAASKLAETISPEDFGASPDAPDNAVAVNLAIAAAQARGAELAWPDIYPVESDLQGFWSVQHSGAGGVRFPDGTVYYVAPTGNQPNALYVAPGGSTSASGLCAAYPSTIAATNSRIRSLGSKADGGVWTWRFLAGVYTDSGIRCQDWPIFRNKLSLVGPEVAAREQPLAIWDGATSSEPYAFRVENYCNRINLRIKDLQVRNFNNNTANSGAFLIWNECGVVLDNLWIENCPFGVSIRYGYIRVWRSRFVGCSTAAVSVTYTATGNIGDTSGGYNEFLDCGHGVDVGRLAIAYIEQNRFTDCVYPIYFTRLSRVRPRGNIFNSWSGAAIYNGLGGLLTSDNGSDQPNIYNQTPTANQPAYQSVSAGINMDYHRGVIRARHVTSNGGLISIQDSIGVATQLSQPDGSWTPFRLPGYSLYGRDWKMEAEFGATFATGAGGTLSLCGNGPPSGTAKMFDCVIAPIAGSRTTRVFMTVFPLNNEAGSQARYRVEIPELGLFFSGAFALNGLMRSADETIRLFRLYWTPSSAPAATFYNLLTYFEG